jgi:hypothetical protein
MKRGRSRAQRVRLETTRARLYIRRSRHKDERMRPWSTARRRVSGSAHAFVEVTSRRVEAELDPSHHCVSYREMASQIVDAYLPPAKGGRTSTRTGAVSARSRSAS